MVKKTPIAPIRRLVLVAPAVSLLWLLPSLGQTEAHLRQLNNHKITSGDNVGQPYPFFVEWQDYGCGGSLIWEDFMLTASHCLWGTSNPFLRVVQIGGRKVNQGAATRTLTKWIPHPEFNQSMYSLDYTHDIMLVKLNASALVDKKGHRINDTAIIPYNTQSSLPQANDDLIVMGFGLKSPTAYFGPTTLQQVDVQAWSQKACIEAYDNHPAQITPATMFCASGPNGKDSCQGDSGGPIVRMGSEETMVQMGVVSFGESCGGEEFPGVYSRTSVVHEWIHDTLCQWSCHPPPDCDPNMMNACAMTTDNNNDLLNMTLQLNVDRFPNEVGIILTHVETATELLFVPYDTLGQTTFSFVNQPRGTYRIVVGDLGRDGICCDYGQGNLTLTDDDTGEELWFQSGDFGSLFDVEIMIGVAEEVVTESSSSGGIGIGIGIGIGVGTEEEEESSSSCIGNCGQGNTVDDNSHEIGFLDASEYEYILQSGKLLYPESGGTHQFLLNIQYDVFSPQQQEWVLEQRLTGTNFAGFENKWTRVETGPPPPSSSFRVYPIQNLEEGSLYRLVVRDAQGDGMSAKAWVVLTNGTATETNPNGTIMWVLRGTDFSTLATAHIWVDAQGNTHILREGEVQQYATSQQQQEDPFLELASSRQDKFNVGERRHPPDYDTMNPP